MTTTSRAWEKAQTRERAYYQGRAASHQQQTSSYTAFHAPMWREILDLIPEVKFEDGKTYLDVGCGPNPIVGMAEAGRRVGIDPLMNFYKENFVFPEGFEGYEGTAETLQVIDDHSIDAIFSMNNIDHIDDIDAASAAMRRSIRDDGTLVLAVNIVLGAIPRLLHRFFDIYRIIDPTHTYHFHSPDEVAQALSSRFTLNRWENVSGASQRMAERKRDAESSPTLKMHIARALRRLKNDVLLAEEMHLFVFEPVIELD